MPQLLACCRLSLFDLPYSGEVSLHLLVVLSYTILYITYHGFIAVPDPVLLSPEMTQQKNTTSTQSGNLFHPNFSQTLCEVSEHGLTQWLNSVFAPCIAANSTACHVNGATSQLKDICAPGTTTYLASVARAARLLRSSVMIGPGQRIEREVDEGKIIPTTDLSFSVDKGWSFLFCIMLTFSLF